MTAHEPVELSAEARRANARLRAALARTDRDFVLAKILVRAAQSPVPDVGPGVTVEIHHTPGHPTGTDWWAVTRVGAVVRVVLADTAGPATPAGATLPLLTRVLAEQYADRSPGELLAAENKDLFALGLDDPPVVAMTVLHLNAESGRFILARAGTPRPLVESAEGLPTELPIPGPLLGLFDAAAFPENAGELQPGEQLVLSTDGTVENSEDLTRVVVGYDTGEGQS
jgi:serine phosphatase RsbU (regulator of sigma subunit)